MILTRLTALVLFGAGASFGSSQPDSDAERTIRQIFDPSGSSPETQVKSEAVTACCGAGCALGLCNGRIAETIISSGTAASSNPTISALNLAGTATACCSRSCPDGHCRNIEAVPTYSPKGTRGSSPPGPRRPNPLVPGRPESDCPGGCGRECGISCPCVCARAFMTSITDIDNPEATVTAVIAKGSEANVGARDAADGGGTEEDFELTQYFHTLELTGYNQDVLPIVVESASKQAFTLLADIDLALVENYISSFFVSSLNLTSSMTQIPNAEQSTVALGIGSLLVTPHSRVKFTLLAGPTTALKKYPDVEFNVFELPIAELKGQWEPELFLGVTFLRRARALTLTQDFAGHGAVRGIRVLAREVVISDDGWDAAMKSSGVEGSVRDEL